MAAFFQTNRETIQEIGLFELKSKWKLLAFSPINRLKEISYDLIINHYTYIVVGDNPYFSQTPNNLLMDLQWPM